MKRIRDHRVVVVGAALAFALAALSATGCSGPASSPASSLSPAAVTTSTVPTPTAPSTAPSGGATSSAKNPGAPTVPKPGVTKQADGQSVVFGTLLHSDLEGGIYVIVDSTPGTAADRAKVLVVIADPELFPLASMQRSYVRAFGVVDTSALSANMAGRQMIVREIKPLGTARP